MSSTPFKDLIAAAAEAKFTVIPAADYVLACRDAQATKSSTGKDMIKMSCKVLVGPHAGASLITQQTLTVDNPSAVAMFLKFLAAHGIEEDVLADLPPAPDGGPNIAAVCGLLKGRVAIGTVSVGQWNEEDRNYIDRFKKPTAEQSAAIEEALKTGAMDAVGASPKAADPFAATAVGPAMPGDGASPKKDPF
jgi:hypothetical protein